jgi:hypothetical protein
VTKNPILKSTRFAKSYKSWKGHGSQCDLTWFDCKTLGETMPGIGTYWNTWITGSGDLLSRSSCYEPTGTACCFKSLKAKPLLFLT